MQRNQHGGCAMMAMGRFSAEVVETGVDYYGLGRCCWMKVGSGDKKTQIFMAYQPSGSSSTNLAGTTVREQHEWYFEARGNLKSARLNFFWAIDRSASSMENNGRRYYITGRFQWKHVHRLDCEASSAPGSQLQQAIFRVHRHAYSANIQGWSHANWCLVCNGWNWMRQRAHPPSQGWDWRP